MNEHLFAITFPVLIQRIDDNGDRPTTAGLNVEVRVYAKTDDEALAKVRNGIIKAINSPEHEPLHHNALVALRQLNDRR